MPMTPTWQQRVGDYMLGKTTVPALSDLWMGLSKTNAVATGLFTGEVSGTGYARINVTSLFTVFDSDGIARNSALVEFGVPGSDWTGDGELLAYVFFATLVTGGEIKYYEEIPNPRAARSGSKSVKWAAGRIRIQHI